MSKKAKTQSHLPDRKSAPRKSGKRGVGPAVDPEDVKELLDLPEQGRLPTMEDAAIEEIETVARKYVRLRDSRQRILKEEVEQKGLLLQVLRRHGKESYLYDDLEIEIVKTAEKVRVKIKKDEGE